MGGDQVVDSPVAWIADHIRDYVETGGEKGHVWRGVPALLITTRGRKTGTLHRTALIYGEVDGDYVVVASKGGSPTHPNWFRNLVANPLADVQVGPERFRVRARTASGEERPRLWRHMARIFPKYDEYQASTDREIPVVVLQREKDG